MIGTGYGRAMSATTSQRPCALIGSISPLITSTMMSSSRVTDRGVNAFDTSRRSRAWSSPLMASRVVLARCHSGPGGDALRLEPQSRRHDESGVAQRRAHQFVAQDLGTVRAHRDRPLLEGFPQVPVRFVGTWGVLVLDGRKVGFEHAWDAHGHLLGLGTIDDLDVSAGRGSRIA